LTVIPQLMRSEVLRNILASLGQRWRDSCLMTSIPRQTPHQRHRAKNWQNGFLATMNPCVSRVLLCHRTL